MFTYIYHVLQRLFNFPDLNELGKGFSKSVNDRLIMLEKKISIYFLILFIAQVLGFILICGCLESGFHWKYLFQI